MISNNVQETEKIAQEIASSFKGGEILALTGDLGAGKTVFVKAVAKYLGIEDTITSPTFVLMKVYDIEYGNINKLVHIDCYRLEGEEDLTDLGLEDYINDNNIVVIEWADKITNLPDNTININIEYISDNKRKIIVKR